MRHAGSLHAHRRSLPARSLLVLVVVLLFAVGWLLLSRDILESRWHSHVAFEDSTVYDLAVKRLSPERLHGVKERIRRYDRSLSAADPGDPFTPRSLNAPKGYAGLLSQVDPAMMGYLQVPSAGISLPVYYRSTDGDDPMDQGAVHMAATAIPSDVDGIHPFIYGHSGLDGYHLFDDLELTKKGEDFTVRVLDQTFHYKVTDIRIVRPEQIEVLDTKYGVNQVTLMTCTPKGVNDHRLLVNGELTGVTGPRVVREDDPSPDILLVTAIPLAGGIMGMFHVDRCRRGPSARLGRHARRTR
ncbi:sortase [Bifidobacterium sp. IMAU50987]